MACAVIDWQKSRIFVQILWQFFVKGCFDVLFNETWFRGGFDYCFHKFGKLNVENDNRGTTNEPL